LLQTAYKFGCHAVCLSAGLSLTIVSYAKTAEPMELPFEIWSQVGPRKKMYYDGVQIPHVKGNFKGKTGGLNIGTVCRELCKNG